MSTFGNDQKELRTQPRPPMWVTRIQLLEQITCCSPPPPRMYFSRKLESGAELGLKPTYGIEASCPPRPNTCSASQKIILASWQQEDILDSLFTKTWNQSLSRNSRSFCGKYNYRPKPRLYGWYWASMQFLFQPLDLFWVRTRKRNFCLTYQVHIVS